MNGRDDEIVYGVYPVQHALESDSANCIELLLDADKPLSARLQALLQRAQAAGCAVRRIARQDLDGAVSGGKHQGVALRRRNPVVTSSDLTSICTSVRPDTLLLVLDGVQDPHNLGACLRTADAAGAKAVIVPKDRAAPVTATVRKIAAGAAEHVPVLPVTNLARCLRQLRDAGIWIIGSSADAKTSLYEVDYCRPLALVLGNEGRGLRRNTRAGCDYLVHLPMRGAVASLNVSVTAGIGLYEIQRQRMASRAQQR